MTEKIDWYKEVLELEPNSKVFYPLARLLAEAGRADEAVAALERGLARHEEFLEARLFLVELLHQTGQDVACAAQLDTLGQVFAAHAGFWRAFAACATRDAAPDTAAVLQLLGLYFARGPVPLHQVLERGVAACWAEGAAEAPFVGQPREPEGVSSAVSPAAGSLAEGAAAPVAVPAEEAEAVADITAPVPPAADVERFDPDAAMADENALPDMDAEATPPPASFYQPAADAGGGPALPPLAGPVAAQGQGEEETFSLRTRSMAEVLAEQGDIKGALDIYHELAAAAVAPEESADLRQRIATLSARLGGGPAAPAVEESPAPTPGGKEKLITMLEALAERVEARAHG